MSTVNKFPYFQEDARALAYDAESFESEWIEQGPAEQFHFVGITECLFPKSSPGLGFKSYSIRANNRVRLALQVNEWTTLPELRLLRSTQIRAFQGEV